MTHAKQNKLEIKKGEGQQSTINKSYVIKKHIKHNEVRSSKNYRR